MPVTHFFAFFTAPDHLAFPADIYLLISLLFRPCACFWRLLHALFLLGGFILHFLTALIFLNFLDLRLGLGLIGYHIFRLGRFQKPLEAGFVDLKSID